MSAERKVLRYEVRVKGLFGRNRSIKYDSWKLVDVPVGESRTVESLMPAFRAKLAEVKFKGGVARLVVNEITFNHVVEGVESYFPSDAETIYTEKVEGGGVVFGT